MGFPPAETGQSPWGRGWGIPKAWVLWGQMKHGKGAEAWAGESA